MDSLLLCPRCSHGAGLHAGSGCATSGCGCGVTRETIVHDALVGAREDIHGAAVHAN